MKIFEESLVGNSKTNYKALRDAINKSGLKKGFVLEMEKEEVVKLLGTKSDIKNSSLTQRLKKNGFSVGVKGGKFYFRYEDSKAE